MAYVSKAGLRAVHGTGVPQGGENKIEYRGRLYRILRIGGCFRTHRGADEGNRGTVTDRETLNGDENGFLRIIP
jgi:hypothetical protein